MLGYNPVCERIIVVRFAGKVSNTTVVQVYAPTSSATDSAIDAFYNQLQDVIAGIPKKDVMIVMGDLNAKLGCDNPPTNNVGRFGLGERNDAGQRLADFCATNQLSVCNTRFQQHPRRLYTWTHPSGKWKNQIDYIMIGSRWRSDVIDAKTRPGADCGTDHNLLVADLRFRLSRRIFRKKSSKLDYARTPACFGERVAERLRTLQISDGFVDMTAEEVWCNTRDAMLEVAQETIPRSAAKPSAWLTEETIEIAKTRRKLRAKGNLTDAERRELQVLNSEFRREARRDKERFLEQKCEQLERFADSHNTRDLFRIQREIVQKSQPRLNAVKDKMGKVLTEDGDIQQRWREYCSELYEANPGHRLPFDATDDDYEREPDVLRSEIVAAMSRIKRGKSTGPDNLPAELLWAVGEEAVNIMHRICTVVWEKLTWPSDWMKSILVVLPKKGDITLCSNNRTIALISHASKVLSHVVLHRAEHYLNCEMAIEQAGYMAGRGTRDQIANLRWLIEKTLDVRGEKLYICFIDYVKAFDCVNHERQWVMLLEFGVPRHLVELLRHLYSSQTAVVRIANGESEPFQIGKGVQQGGIPSPKLFNAYTERIMRRALDDCDSGVRIGGRLVNNLRYADDTTLIATTVTDLEEMLRRVRVESEAAGLRLNVRKTKLMVVGGGQANVNITVEGEPVEVLSSFNFLGSQINATGGSKSDIIQRMAIARNTAAGLDTIWRDHGVSLSTKIRLMKSLVFSVALYGAETWTLTNDLRKRLDAFGMWCWRRLLRINWTDHVTNVTVLTIIGKPLSFSKIVLKRKLSFFGHICRAESLGWTVLSGTRDGRRQRGRPKRLWIDDITETMRMTLQRAAHLARKREEWSRCIIAAVTMSR